MTLREWRKYDWRNEKFLEMFRNGQEFLTYDERSVRFGYCPDIDRIVKDRRFDLYNSIILHTTEGERLPIFKLEKASYFGGKGKGSGVIRETQELSRLQRILKEAQGSRDFITLNVMGNDYACARFDSTPGNPKSDFHVVDPDGNECLWISHKAGATAASFQQWGGLSKKREPRSAGHSETLQFVSDLHKRFPDGLPPKTTIARKIEDPKLKRIAIYGAEYGSAFGRQNVNLVVQGNLWIEKGTLKADMMHWNGEDIVGDYEPSFLAIYKGDRSDFGLKGTRIVIGPIGGRKVTERI